MALELVAPQPEHLPELGLIFFEAFRGIADAHRFPHDLPDPTITIGLMQMLVLRPDFYGVVAIERDAPPGKNVRGFNFLQMSDPVGGVGPLCVAPGYQLGGIGRRLMHNVVEHAPAHHGPMVRLLQEAYNMTSLSLYTSMGYAVKEPIVLLSVPPAARPDATVRPLTLADMPEAEALCRDVYRVSRRNELAAIVADGAALGCVPQGRFRGGELVAYLIPGFLGHAVARTTKDLLDVAQQSAQVSPPSVHRLLVPSRHELFPAALARKFRCIKPLNLMAIGPYEPPQGAWAPSIGY